MWAFMESWFAPTSVFLFLFLGLIIGSIVICHRLAPSHASQPILGGALSLFDRVKSINISSYKFGPQEPAFSNRVDSVGTSNAFLESHNRSFDVFLNFRGPDSRYTVVDVLYDTLNRAGIHVFYDDEEIRKGEVIKEELWLAITNSKIYIPIFSKDYASSHWCLRELKNIVDCWRNSSGKENKVILPIFYDVDVSTDLKLRSDMYLTSLQKHRARFDVAEVKSWEAALKEVSTISGWNLKNHGLVKLAEAIKAEVFTKLNPRKAVLPYCTSLVGMDDQIKVIANSIESDDDSLNAKFIVIHGTGGVGKTTIAKYIYKKISSCFQGSCILEVRRSLSKDNMVKLQQKLLSDTLHHKHIEVSDTDDGIEKLSWQLRDRKVLIVLDDINKKDHLKNLVAKSDWFGPKSRIIITTRNIDFLPTKNSEEYPFYKFIEMKKLNHGHALQLFCRHAFENDFPPLEYYDISKEIVATTGGLPLALEVIGSSLHNQNYGTWILRLKKLKEAPHEDVQETLKISYIALEHEEHRQIFLDIACFFNNEEKTDPIYFWEACGFLPNDGIDMLVCKSLIKVIDDDKLWMHDQLRDLGRAIAQSKVQSLLNLTPKMSKRLWSSEVALDVVRKKKGDGSIVALQLGKLDVGCSFVHEEFVELVNLKFLQLHGGNFEGDFANVFHRLIWLSWLNCPLKFQATNLNFDNLVILKLQGSHITNAWNGWHPIMEAKCLKVLNLTRCPYLTRTPSFSKFLALQRLILTNCDRLKEIDHSIKKLTRLNYLEISYYAGYSSKIFSKLQLLPNSIGDLTSLAVLKILHAGLQELHDSVGKLVALNHLCLRCPHLEKLPKSMGKLMSLVQLDISFSGIKELPDSIGNLTQLNILRANSSMLRSLPESIGRLKSLIELDLSMTEVTILPDTIKNLKMLKIMSLSRTPIVKLPEAIGSLDKLELLYVDQCTNMDGKISEEIGNLSSLRSLRLYGTPIHGVPTTICRLYQLQELSLGEINKALPRLPASLTSLVVSHLSLDSGRVLDLSNLTNLVTLSLSCALSPFSKVTVRRITTLEIEWLVNLKKLEELKLMLSRLTLPQLDLSSLSQLRHLDVTCFDPSCLTQLPPKLENFILRDVKEPAKIEGPLFCSLKNLSTFVLDKCQWNQIRVGALVELENLRILRFLNCEAELLDLSSLKNLQQLKLYECSNLTKIRGLNEVRMLQSLEISQCNSIKGLPDLSSLGKLERLFLGSCESLRSLPNIANKETCHLEVEKCAGLRDFKGHYDDYVCVDRKGKTTRQTYSKTPEPRSRTIRQ